MTAAAERFGLDPALFRPEAIDPETRAFPSRPRSRARRARRAAAFGGPSSSSRKPGP